MAVNGFGSRIKRITRSFGWELIRTGNANQEQYVLKNVLQLGGVTTVLDVGANAGQYGDLVFGLGFKGGLISFEAIPNVHRALVDHAARRTDRWRVAPCAAIGSEDGEIEINIAGNSVSSSVLAMNKAHLDAAPQSQYVGRQRVPLKRLDGVAPALIDREGPILVKVDTQGYELEVLKGMTGLLPRVAALQLELSLVPLYDGSPPMTEVMAFVQALGFKTFGLVPSFWDAQTGQLFQMDGFFIRS
jgi:FkbM family methyltransferase